MRPHGLLTSEDGGSPLEVLFAIAFLVMLMLGVVEIAFALYGRNVILASAHEAARAAIELGRAPEDAERVASDTVRQSAAGLIEDLAVRVTVDEIDGDAVAEVRVSGVLVSFGPVPLHARVAAVAHAARDSSVP